MAPKQKPGKTPSKKPPQDLAAHTEALNLHAAALKAHTASMNNLAAAIVGSCGGVNHGVGPITGAQIKALVLQCIARLPGAPPNPSSKDDTKINTLVGGDDPIWYLAQECENFGRFDADGLNPQPNYFRTNGATLGGFVKCIRCCYNHPNPAS
jgi:hypothetical protein